MIKIYYTNNGSDETSDKFTLLKPGIVAESAMNFSDNSCLRFLSAII
ncbi:hypothetical protein MtrunA17_Chr4g0002811 [Medicago truncatula]|uniref:Uncharacterized protein n=1 Tax=Medicago truncatula TaxID=3880 RepID=A0A396HYR9_MEDTR|nr:hypothetical protein MtrunA17_Chr4g0002811 [Medicago truncatula]